MNSHHNLSRIVQPSQSDVDFWTQQLTEHILFLHQLLNSNVVPSLKEEAKIHYKSWYALLHNTPILYNPNLIASLYSFLETIDNKITNIKTLLNNQSIESINLELPLDDFHSLVKHMILEQTYFTRLIEGKITIKDEFLFWAQENTEHTELVSHLLPPGNLKNEIIKLLNSMKHNHGLIKYDPVYFSDKFNLIKQSNITTSVIHGAVHSGQIRTINDAMLEHEMREAQKGEERIQFLLKLL